MKKRDYSGRFGRKQYYLISIAVAASTLFLGAETAPAAEWRTEPVFRLGYEYDDNATLNAVTAPSEISGFLLDASATFGYATERTTFDITPLLRSRNYDDEAFDSNDGFLALDFNTQSLKSNFRFRGNYSSESVRTAERANADPGTSDPDEIPGDDTGRVFATDRRDKFWVMPEWSYDFSEKSALSARLVYTDVDYDDAPVTTFVPYSDLRFEASLSRRFSTRTRWYIKGSGRTYEPDNAGVGSFVDIDGVAVSIGFDRGLTETTRFRAEVGVEETTPSGGLSESNTVWDINVIRNLQTVNLLAQVKRSMNAGGAGGVSERDSFNLGITKQFSGRVKGGLGLRAYSTNQLGGSPGTVDERDYVQFQAQMSYALSRSFLVQADYRYTYLDRSSVTADATSNSIILWLIYQPTAITASR